MDQFQLLKLLQGSIDQQDQIRNESLKQLDLTFQQLNDLNLLIQLIAEKNQLAEIYFNYWLQNHFEQQDLQSKQQTKIILIQLYNTNQGTQIKKALRFVLLKEQDQQELFQWVLLSKDLELVYYLLKELQKEEGDSQRVKILCQQSQSLINNNSLEISLKLIILSQKIIKNHNQDQFEIYLKELEQQVINNNFKLVYLLQKTIISQLTYNRNLSLVSLSKLLQILDKIYFSNKQLKQITIQFQSEQQFKTDLQNLKESPNQQQKLILQVLKILKLLLQNHTYDPLQGLLQVNENGLEFELILYEGYFRNILTFFIQNALVLSPQQIYDIFFDQEEAFAENSNSSYEIRDTAIDFLIASLQSHKADDVIQIMTQHFQQAPLLQNFENIVQKEAIYFIIRNVMQDMQFDIDLYIQQFQQELLSNEPLFDPLKIQILQILIIYLKYSEQIPQDISDIIINIILTLQTQNKCVLLLQIECLGQMIEIIDNPAKFWPNVQNIYSQFKNEASKICIFQFYIQLTKKDQFQDHSWILQQFYQEWQQNNISIQEKIIETLIEIVLRNEQLSQHITICQFIIQSIFNQKQQILIEVGIELLLVFLSKCQILKIQLCQDFIIFIQNIMKNQLINQSEFWIQCILLQTYLIYQKNYNDQLMKETLFMQIKQFQEIKDEAYEYIFIPLHLYIEQNQQSHLDFNLLILNYLITQQLQPSILMKLGNYLGLINDLIVSDQITSQILQAHLMQKEFQLELFKNFLILLKRSNSNFIQHCEQIYQEQKNNHLETDKNYIITELRQLLGNRRLRIQL